MKYEQYVKAKPHIFKRIYTAVHHTVSSMSFQELKTLDWMTSSADRNTESEKKRAA